MRTSPAFTVDGAYGEGGSALLRTLLQVSAITQQALVIEHIRGGTKMPGLTDEDRAIAQALATSVSAPADFELGSSRLEFVPKRRPRSLNSFPEGSAEFTNACVAAATLIPVLARSGAYSSFKVPGETHGLAALSFEPFQEVTLRALRHFGIYADATLLRAGFGRGNGGEILVEVEPSAINGFSGEVRGGLKSVRALIAISELPDVVGHRGLSHLERLCQSAGLNLDGEVVNVKSKQPGVYVSVWAEYDHGIGVGTQMGQKGVRIESVAQQAFQQVFEYMQSGATYDPFTVDQVLFAAANAEGESLFSTNRITQRLLTQVWAIKQLMPIIITVKGQEGGPGLIRVKR